MGDFVNKAAKIVINHCLDNQIGAVVFGWNQGQRQKSNLQRLSCPVDHSRDLPRNVPTRFC